ncbi:MAG: Uma2 family endonuclease [Myxococcales bacterium]|nr:Uma2 family endonuclease [Myxococcales bacterium]
MTQAARKRATYEDVLAADPRQIAEVLDGVLHTQPRPALPHAQAASELAYELIGPFRRGRGGPGGWHILIEPELHLGPEPDILVPDLAGWRTSRLPRIPNEPFEIMPPDWVAEILSPSTTRTDRSIKLPIYQREQVGHVWLIDPQALTIEVLSLDGEGYRLLGVHAGRGPARLEPFDAVELELGALWIGDDD